MTFHSGYEMHMSRMDYYSNYSISNFELLRKKNCYERNLDHRIYRSRLSSIFYRKLTANAILSTGSQTSTKINWEAERGHALLIHTRIYLNRFHRSTDILAFGFLCSFFQFRKSRNSANRQLIKDSERSECKPSSHGCFWLMKIKKFII